MHANTKKRELKVGTKFGPVFSRRSVAPVDRRAADIDQFAVDSQDHSRRAAMGAEWRQSADSR
jgi:hypothetical protein